MKRVLWGALCTAAAAVLIVAMPGTDAVDADTHTAKKRAHFHTVVDELAARDVPHLDAEQRVLRAETLERLARYADAGRFPVDERFTGFGVPYLIDDHGTRCALAHLVDESGGSAIVERLANTHNHAFVPGLMQDRELQGWLRDHGLSVEEAAFIQLPPFTDDDRVDDNPDPQPEPEPDPFTPRTPDITPDRTSPVTPDVGPRRRPATTRVAAPTWKGWWDLNRHTFVDLRERYHDSAVITQSEDDETPTGYRPRPIERDRILAPTLLKLSKEPGEVGGVALMALARMGRADDAAIVTERALAYVGKRTNRYRGMMLLAVGLTRTETGADALAAIIDDNEIGRRHLASKGTLPEQTRAYAAVALGLSGRAAATDTLLAVLADEKKALVDLRAACVAALGRIGKDAPTMQRTRIRAKLIDGARTRKWHDDVVAAVPAALLHMNDSTGLTSLTEHLARFRKPTALRQSLALALGADEARHSRAGAEVLLATARRDPDPLTRRYAIAGLGRRTPGGEVAGDEAAKTRRLISRFFISALQGHQVQNVDRPWVYLGAALHVRANPEAKRLIVPALIKAASGGGAREARSAAAIALGLVGGPDARATLRKLLDTTRDAEVRPSVAEALGLLGDRESRKTLLTMVRTDGSAQTRYRAAVGLGYLADRTTISELVRALTKARSVPVQAALTRVIAEIGDRSAISALTEIAGDAKTDTPTRTRAIAALGLIGETASPTWVQGFKHGANRARATPTMKVILSIF